MTEYKIEREDGSEVIIRGDGFFCADDYLFIFMSYVYSENTPPRNMSVACFAPGEWKSVIETGEGISSLVQ